MKRLIFILLPLLLNAESFIEIIKKVEQNEMLRAKEYEIKAKKEILNSRLGKNLPSIDASLQGLYLQEEPRMFLHLGIFGMPSSFQAASINQYRGEIALSYPLFTGFAITNMIQKSKIDLEKSKLEKKDIKRNLYMKAALLYSEIFALNEGIKAANEALKAVDISYKKAIGFYNQGLIAQSEVYNIEAKKYEIKANLEELKSKKKNLFYMLGYLTKSKIDKIDGLLDIDLKKIDFEKEIEKREDILALKKALKLDEKDILLAKSALYPKLYLKAGLRGYGDDLKFDGDGYRNGNESYVSFVLTQNIFNGFSDKAKIEAAKYKKLSRNSYLNDYKRKVLTILKSEQNLLKALEIKLNWAKKRVRAQYSYYKLTKGRFDNQLSSADELMRSIASLANAKANLANIKAQIFNQKCKILLEISLNEFIKNLNYKK